ALVGDADSEAVNHDVANGVRAERGQKIGADVHPVAPHEVGHRQSEEGEEDDRQGQVGDAEGRHAPAHEQLAPRLGEEHLEKRRLLRCHARLVRLRNASSRSAPVTSRAWIVTPRSNSALWTCSGSLLTSPTRWPGTSRLCTGRPWKVASPTTAATLKVTRLLGIRALISRGVASAMTIPRSITTMRLASWSASWR